MVRSHHRDQPVRTDTRVPKRRFRRPFRLSTARKIPPSDMVGGSESPPFKGLVSFL